jgi:hypothetical protein
VGGAGAALCDVLGDHLLEIVDVVEEDTIEVADTGLDVTGTAMSMRNRGR